MGFETTSVLAGLKTRVHKDFQSAMTSAQPWWNGAGKGVMTALPILLATATFAWMAELGGMREFNGPREIDRVKERSFQVPVKKYEKTVAVNIDRLMDNENAAAAGIVTAGAIAGAIGEVVARLPDDLLIYNMQNGQSTVCYDGQYLYDTDHPTVLDGAAGSQSNYEASGFALTQPNFATARARMMSFKGENGLPRPYAGRLILEVPPALESAARTIVEAEKTSSGATNITRGWAEVRVNPRLAGQDTTWYLHLVDGPGIGAICFLDRDTAKKLITKVSPENDNVFFDQEAIFGTDGVRCAAIPGAWWKTFKAAA